MRYYVPLALAALLAACGGGDDAIRGERPTPLVRAEAAGELRFVDRIEAVGTAQANEQVTLSAPVTERIIRLNFDDGSFVRRGQVIAVLQQAQQSAQLTEVQARAREATQQLERIGELKDRGFATRSSYDAQVAAAEAARAQAAQVQAQIGERVITAPFAGWVSLRNISAGAIASQGTPIATISDTSVIKLDFPVPETMLATVRPGQPIEAVSAAFPGTPFRGTIDTIDAVVDPNTRAIMVRARLPNPDGRLRPGMMMTVGIETQPRTALAVPELAIIGEGDTRYVYVVDEEGAARRKAVRTGIRQAGHIEIVEGLRPGERVVTEGVVKLAEGMQVRLAGPRNAEGAPEAPEPADRPRQGG